MSAKVTLVPGGTARALLLGEPSGARTLEGLARRWAERAELHASSAFVASDLVRLVGRPGGAPLAEPDARAVVALLLLLLDALERGSTAIAIATGAERDRLGERLREMDVDGGAIRTVRGWLDALAGSALPSGAPAPVRQLRLELGSTGEEPRVPPLVPLLAAPSPDERALLVVSGGRLALARWALAESRIEGLLRGRHASLGSPEVVRATLASLPIASEGVRALEGAQLEAVHAGLTGTTTVITGGPGTGKTSIVVAMLRALVRLPDVGEAVLPRVALAAPTGKAADRLREAIALPLAGATDARDRALARAVQPMTLHRLLGYQPDLDRFRFHGRSRLPARFVVVDEASMIDTMLLSGLLEALDAGACLVLTGDPDQLPSVGAGAVLRDLTELARREPGLVHWSHLEKSHRMKESDPAGAHVLGVARRVAAGEALPIAEAPLVPGALARVRGGASEGASILVPEDPAALGRWLDGWFDALPTAPPALLEGASAPDPSLLSTALAAAHAARLLVVTRSAAQRTGQDAVNAYLGARHAARIGRTPGGALLPGEPAVVIANDYVRNVFNGDTGLVIAHPDGPMLALAQRGEVRLLPLADVAHHLERAWALTVHRAQGSEHDRVALLLPESDVPRLFTRQIVYTAITRARRAVTIVGDPALLAAAIARRDERTTNLGAAGAGRDEVLGRGSRR